MNHEPKTSNPRAGGIKRRAFIKAGGAAVAAATVNPAIAAEKPAPMVVVAKGTDIAKMIEEGMAKMGGWDKFFKPGAKVAIKPNLAWKSTPEQGGNTHPDILRAVVLAAESRKVKQITIPENTCQPEKETFPASGAIDALKGTKAKLYRPKPTDYKEVEKQNQELQQHKQELEEQLKNSKTDKFIEEEAREQLRMVKPGETVFIVPNQDAGN